MSFWVRKDHLESARIEFKVNYRTNTIYICKRVIGTVPEKNNTSEERLVIVGIKPMPKTTYKDDVFGLTDKDLFPYMREP